MRQLAPLVGGSVADAALAGPVRGRPARDLEPRAATLRNAVEGALFALGQEPLRATPRDWLAALAQIVKEQLGRRAADTAAAERLRSARRVNYLSMEFLPGRALLNALLALDLLEPCRAALAETGVDLDAVLLWEPDPALGNGGLARLAACFLDSLATLALPAFGYGVRYEQGLFQQRIRKGWQAEQPDDWLAAGSLFEFARPEIAYAVRFGGHVERRPGGDARWVGTEQTIAAVHDMIIPGYRTERVATLRLFSARAPRSLDLSFFGRGEHVRALEARTRIENISRVLYPDDGSSEGRELRLRQEYFLASAAMQDVLRRHIEEYGTLDSLADKAAIHLNDTHPALAVPELMRLLVDDHGYAWNRASAMCAEIFSYTNHTLMPDALETWPVGLVGALLPRHLEIVYDINHFFLEAVRCTGRDGNFAARVSAIDEEAGRRVRMAHLSIMTSRRVNGVSRLHSALMRDILFRDFAELAPERFTNETNGITPRRWLAHANPALAAAIDGRIGDGWRRDLAEVEALREAAEEPEFRAAAAAAKAANKHRLAAFVRDAAGVAVDPQSLFDVQVKRIHEQKRQLLTILAVIARWNALRAGTDAAPAPRTVIVAGKAAPGDRMAKLVIKLIHDVGQRINGDPHTGGLLKLVFVPNYCVSAAEIIIPGADLSEQISTAGTEPSGTGNMKLALNGALTLGTADGANLEIRDAVGAANIFIFGHGAAEARELRLSGYDPWRCCEEAPALRQAIDQIAAGFFSPDDPGRYRPIVESLLWEGDRYLVCADFQPFLDAQARVDHLWQDRDAWLRTAVLNVAGMGPFSSDRAVRGYAQDIWRLSPTA